MDYIIADEVVIPHEQGLHYCEQIIYLPHSYHVNDDARKIANNTVTRIDAGLPKRGFCFLLF